MRDLEGSLDRQVRLERQGQRRGELDGAEILASQDAPAWVHDRARLWNQVEAAERRKDA